MTEYNHEIKSQPVEFIYIVCMHLHVYLQIYVYLLGPEFLEDDSLLFCLSWFVFFFFFGGGGKEGDCVTLCHVLRPYARCVDEPVWANGCRQWNTMTLTERSEGNLAALVLNFHFVLETGSLPHCSSQAGWAVGFWRVSCLHVPLWE